MSIHISAQPGEIAKAVLLPGDPLRARYIAENYLENVQLVSSTRNIYFYTGMYKNRPVTVGASGMGCASIGIYSYELFTEYNVDAIIRIGTCGAYTKKLKLFDLVNVATSYSESTYAKHAFGYKKDNIGYQGPAFDCINQTAKKLSLKVKKSAVHSSDVFYRKEKGNPAIVKKYNCTAVEMEAFALFSNAQYLNKTAACLLTVSDIIPTHEKISADEREKALKPMIALALESAILLK
jgi:purine-nucleoside phosphorylase